MSDNVRIQHMAGAAVQTGRGRFGGRNTSVLRVRRRRSGPEVVLNRYLPTRRTEAVFQG